MQMKIYDNSRIRPLLFYGFFSYHKSSLLTISLKSIGIRFARLHATQIWFSLNWFTLFPSIFFTDNKGSLVWLFCLERCCYFRRRMRISLDNHSITQTQKRNIGIVLYTFYHFILLSSALFFNFSIFYCTVCFGQYSVFLSTACLKLKPSFGSICYHQKSMILYE